MWHPMMQSCQLGEPLLEAHDHGLSATGKIVRPSIFERFKSSYPVKRVGIGEKLQSTHLALQNLPGARAKVMENQIAKNLCARLGLNVAAHEDCILMDYVNHAREARVSD
jgi:hypothetical protein